MLAVLRRSPFPDHTCVARNVRWFEQLLVADRNTPDRKDLVCNFGLHEFLGGWLLDLLENRGRYMAIGDLA